MSEEQTRINLTIAKGSGIVFLGIALSKLVNLPTSIILARYFGASDYGLLMIGSTLIGVIASVSVLGMGMGLSRFVQYYRERDEIGLLRRILEFGSATVLICSTVAGIVVFFSADWIAVHIFKKHDLINLVRILSISIPMLALVEYVTGLFRGLKKLHYIFFYNELTGPLLRLLILIILVLLGLNIYYVAMSYVLVASVTLLMALVIFKRDDIFIELRARKSGGSVKEFLKYSYPLAIAVIVKFARRRFDLLFIGAILVAKEVGIYNIAVSVGLLLNIPLLGINRILLPVASGLVSLEKLDELRVTYKSSSRWCMISVLPFLMFILFFAKDLIAFLYGSEFTSGADALRIVALAVSINVSTGSSGEYLQAFGRSRVVMLILIIGSLVYIAGLLTLVPIYGISGAALSFFVSMIFMVIIGFSAVLQHKVHPFSRLYFLGLIVGISFYYVFFSILKKLFSSYQYMVLIFFFFIISLLFYIVILVLLNILTNDEKRMIWDWIKSLIPLRTKRDITNSI